MACILGVLVAARGLQLEGHHAHEALVALDLVQEGQELERVGIEGQRRILQQDPAPIQRCIRVVLD